MTAQELIAALSAHYLDTKQMLPDELAHGSAAMLSQQVEKIEALKAAYTNALDELATRNYSLRKENEELKADAKRLDWLLKNTHMWVQWDNRAGWIVRERSEGLSIGVIWSKTPRLAIDAAMKGAT